MKTSTASNCSRRLQPLCLGLLLLLFLIYSFGLKAGVLAPTNVIQKAEDIRDLTVAQASQHYPVKLQGVITFYDTNLFMRFIQDETAGIYFFPFIATNGPALAAGQLVELEGTTDPGEYAPVVQPGQIKVLSTGTFPPARPVTYQELASGEEDSQFVDVQGVVRAVDFDPQTKYYSLEIETGCGRVTALVAKLPVKTRDLLVDSAVRIHGVCATRFTSRRQLFDIRLLLPRPTDLVVELPAPQKPFAAPLRPISQVLQFAPHSPLGHRVKVEGTVIYAQDQTLYIENETDGLYVRTKQADSVIPGDRVEVLGFPAQGEYTPLLQDAIFRKIGSVAMPLPQTITADEALKGTCDSRLVRIEATILDRGRQSPDEFLALESDGCIFLAYRERKTSGVNFAYLKNGSKVAVTGICRVDAGSGWRVGPDWRAKSFNLLVRWPRDIEVLNEPSP